MLVTVNDRLMGVGCQSEKEVKMDIPSLHRSSQISDWFKNDSIAFNGFLAKMSFPHLKAGRTAGTVAG